MTFEEVERARERYKKIMLKRGGITAIILFGIISFPFINEIIEAIRLGLSSDFIIGLLLVMVIVVPVLTGVTFLVTYSLANYRGLGKTYAAAYKSYFVGQSLRRVFTDLDYDHEKGLESWVIRDTGMIRTGGDYYSDDLVTGRYKDAKFTQADVYLGDTDDDGSVKYFKGRWMIFEFPKKFNFELKVVERGFHNHTRPNGHKMKRIEVESSNFNKLFKIYAEDGFEAFYLLDPALLEGIVKLGNSYTGKIMLCFVEDQLHVALYDNKNAFEPPLNFFKPLDEKAEMEKVAQGMRVITDFVDGLRLDKKIFQ